jgi:MFS family permease
MNQKNNFVQIFYNYFRYSLKVLACSFIQKNNFFGLKSKKKNLKKKSIVFFFQAFVTSKYGGKLFFGAGIGLCSILSLMMPLAEKIGPFCIMILRILQGLSQGCIFPAMHCLWSKWAPPTEVNINLRMCYTISTNLTFFKCLKRSRLATFALSGSYIGSVVALSCSGVISSVLNWKWIFYIFGGLGMCWTILWFLFIEESPSKHSNISAEERLHIESSISCVIYCVFSKHFFRIRHYTIYIKNRTIINRFHGHLL